MIRNGNLLPRRFIPTGNRSMKADMPERLKTFHQITLWDTYPDPAVPTSTACRRISNEHDQGQEAW
jgi:hypothetical protein